MNIFIKTIILIVILVIVKVTDEVYGANVDYIILSMIIWWKMDEIKSD